MSALGPVVLHRDRETEPDDKDSQHPEDHDAFCASFRFW